MHLDCLCSKLIFWMVQDGLREGSVTYRYMQSKSNIFIFALFMFFFLSSAVFVEEQMDKLLTANIIWKGGLTCVSPGIRYDMTSGLT